VGDEEGHRRAIPVHKHGLRAARHPLRRDSMTVKGHSSRQPGALLLWSDGAGMRWNVERRRATAAKRVLWWAMPGLLTVLCSRRPRILFWSPTRVQRSGKSPHMIGQPRFKDRRAEITIPKDAISLIQSPILRAKSHVFGGFGRPLKTLNPSLFQNRSASEVTIAMLTLRKIERKVCFSRTPGGV
jgi:hypothetical protein